MRPLRAIIAFIGLILTCCAFAAEPTDTVYVERGTIVIFHDDNDTLASAQNTAFPEPITQIRKTATHTHKNPLDVRPIKVRFAWGADVGSSIDMSGADMSSIDLSIYFGLSRGWLNFFGVGAQGDIMVSNSCRSFPLFGMFRTNFTDRPTRMFWELKGGYSLNYLEHNHQQNGIYGSTGIGIKLATSAKFSSHMTLGYTYLERKKVVGTEMTHDFKPLHYATVKIGVVF